MANTEKASYRRMLSRVRRKRDQLRPDSHVRRAISDELLEQVEQRIHRESVAQLDHGKWPITMVFLESSTTRRAESLDGDIDAVLSRTPHETRNNVPSFLWAKGRQARSAWYSGLFDLWTKANAIKKQLAIDVDHKLPNGRNSDIWLSLQKREMCIECTAITEDDESCQVWDRFMQAKMGGCDGALRRPGSFCNPGAKGPSPYYNALRFYAKVYDKLASKKLNPAQSQFATATPSVLLLSFAGPGVKPDMHGIDWALDELFMVQPRWQPTQPTGTARAACITLPNWLDVTAERLIASGSVKQADYDANRHRLLQAPRTIGAVLLFNDCQFVAARMNYNALPEHRLTHAEMAKLEKVFKQPPLYGRRPRLSRKSVLALREALDVSA